MASSKNKITPKKLSNIFKNMAVYVLIGLAALIFFVNLSSGLESGERVPISTIISDIKNDKVERLVLENDDVKAFYKESEDGQKKILETRKEGGESIYRILESSGTDPNKVAIEIKDTSFQQGLASILGTVLLPMLLLGGLLFFLMRRVGDAGQSIFSFGQSKAKVFSKDAPQIKFDNVAGVWEAKKELSEIVEFLKTPEKFTALGARTPKGVLLVGPAGVGKTLLARAVAGEAGVPFFSIAGSEFMEILVGVGAARVRDLFAQAKKSAPSIIFIDEIESIGRMRGMGFSGGHDEREQTLNQILVEMDGFTPNDHVIIIGATNRPDMLDPALARPGRFDRRVTLGYPDIEERKAIIELNMKGKPFTKDVDLEKLARRTVGFSGADLANMLNEGAILAAREGKKAIDPVDLEEAATKVKLGPQRKRMQTEEDRKLAAYHEAGHAIVGHFLKHIDPVHRITIVSRGMSGGHTMFPPAQDRSNESRSRLVDQITTALGGQVSEKLVMNDISTGAASDLEIATAIARAMVSEYGMSELGPIALKPHPMFGMWSRMSEEGSDVSPDLQNAVDTQVKRILDECYKRAGKILKAHLDALHKVAEALLERESLDGDDFEKLVGKKMFKDSEATTSPVLAM
jgi:cell division protease FtsH